MKNPASESNPYTNGNESTKRGAKNPLSRPGQKGCGNWYVFEVCVLGQANLMDLSADCKT